ncbi:TlpA family protein disulfide reductase [Chitinophaga rhizosphaerae]|uniref:TlpA family protein disulfide reductase n=1 Tax=Chitinophaga rhizosphaerae TaxID=1864947 RepID=UPI000F8073C7|nr:TlpA disulfide reductase family protein [Chitinophaga rhizosphaerae]
MKLHSYSLIIILLTCSFAAMAQDRNITIDINTPEFYNNTKGRSISIIKEKEIWCANGRTDSVLWEVNYGKSKEPACKDIPGLQVLAKRDGAQVKVCILKRYNPFLEKEEVLSYPYDSVRKWNKKNWPEDAIPRLVFKLPYCIGNAVTLQSMEMYFFPFFIGVDYNNPCLNELPLSVSLGRSGVAEFGDAVLFFNKPGYMHPDDKVVVKVKENGVLQDDRTSDGLIYKSGYRMKDTLVIGGKLFRIDSIGSQWDKAYLRRLTAEKRIAKLPERHMRTLAPYFEQAKEYVLLDFWGTWCAPCIAGMPKLRALHDKVKSEVPFVSVCFDEPKNFAKAKEIFAENRLSWPQVFNSTAERESTLTKDLSITTFPTYMLVKKNGDIFYSTSGDGFDELSGLLLKGK